MVEYEALYRDLRGDQVGKLPGLGLAVAVGYVNDLVLRVENGLLQVVLQGDDGALPAPGGTDLDEAALIVHVHHGLDLQRAAQNGGGLVHPTAPVEEEQVVDGEECEVWNSRIEHILAEQHVVVIDVQLSQECRRQVLLASDDVYFSAFCQGSASPYHRYVIVAEVLVADADGPASLMVRKKYDKAALPLRACL